MGALPTFLIPDFDAARIQMDHVLDRDVIPPETLQHFKARRIARGERVEILDGAGSRIELSCEDPPASRYRVTAIKRDERLKPNIELCLSVPKGDAFAEAVTQATEIGATSIRLLRTEHGQVAKVLDAAPAARAQRLADAACEQCARSWRMRVFPDWHSLDRLVADPSYLHVVADESLARSSQFGASDSATMNRLASAESLRLYIGPEGGWSESERQIFDGPALKMGLGPLVLRVPTAIVAAIHHIRVVHAARETGTMIE